MQASAAEGLMPPARSARERQRQRNTAYNDSSTSPAASAIAR